MFCCLLTMTLSLRFVCVVRKIIMYFPKGYLEIESAAAQNQQSTECLYYHVSRALWIIMNMSGVTLGSKKSHLCRVGTLQASNITLIIRCFQARCWMKKKHGEEEGTTSSSESTIAKANTLQMYFSCYTKTHMASWPTSVIHGKTHRDSHFCCFYSKMTFV